MSTPKKTGAKANKPAETVTDKIRRKPRRRRSAKALAVDRMIKDFKKKLGDGDIKVSVGDFIRLAQLQDEMQLEEPREIRVTWVEPEQTESTNAT